MTTQKLKRVAREAADITLWALVLTLMVAGIAAAIWPYRAKYLLSNLSLMLGPDKSHILPTEGIVIRIPLKVDNCQSTPWIAKLAAAKVISVDGICNVSLTPEGERFAVRHFGKPTDCNAVWDGKRTSFYNHTANPTHVCVYSAYFGKDTYFSASGGQHIAWVNLIYHLHNTTPFSQVDPRKATVITNGIGKGDLIAIKNEPTSNQEFLVSDEIQLNSPEWAPISRGFPLVVEPS